MKKFCKQCQTEKPVEEFDRRSDKPGYRSECKVCHRARSRKWKEKNPERARELSRKSAAAFFKRNPERVRVSAKASVIRRLATDPAYKVLHNLRRRIRQAIFRGDKSDETINLIGCSVDQLMGQIEIQFQEGMTWENYGEWHIDHKRPCASFDLTDAAEQRECFSYKNLQPLWDIDNRRKSARWP